MPLGMVKWFDGEKGYGFILRMMEAKTSSCITQA